jgi:hypothetical protein
MDELEGFEIPQHKKDEVSLRVAKWMGLIICLGVLFLTILILCTSGCVTATKQTYHQIVDTPTPTPTPEPTPEPEVTEVPVVMVTEDPVAYMLRTNGLSMRTFYHWFRADVQGINSQGTHDLSTYATVYDYRFMDSYRWWSVSWYRKFVVKPDKSDEQFLFIFANIYSDDRGDGLGDDVRQYAMGCDHFAIQTNDERIYQADYIEYPERRITEFDDLWDFAHVQSPGWLGYKIVQEKGSGIITAQSLEWLMGGRSNAHDGVCLYQIPRKDSEGNPVNATTVKVLGNFGTFGQVWWKLK